MDSLLPLLTESPHTLLKLVSADTHGILYKHKGNGEYTGQLYKSPIMMLPTIWYAPVMCTHNTFNS